MPVPTGPEADWGRSSTRTPSDVRRTLSTLRTETAPEATVLRGTRVLVIDGDPAVVSFLETSLSRYGCLVLTALGAEAGLETLRAEKVDALIFDWLLPRMPGERLIKLLKESHPTLAFAVMSGALRSPATQAEVRRMGAGAVFAKPFTIELVVQWLTRTHAPNPIPAASR